MYLFEYTSLQEHLIPFFKIITDIGGQVGGLLYLLKARKDWKNRDHIFIHNVRLSSDKIKITMENLGIVNNSIKPKIKINGVLPSNKTLLLEEAVDQSCDLTLLPRKQTTLYTHKITNPQFAFLWYITITVEPTITKAIKLRFRNINQQYKTVRFIRFMIEKNFFKLFPQAYHRLFKNPL